MSEYGYIPEAPEQSFGNNKGIFNPKDIYDLTRADKYTNYGQLELIETQTASSDSAIDFTSIDETKYNVHFMTVSITDLSSADYLGIRFFESGVVSTSTVYQEAYQNCQANGTFNEVRATRNQIITTQSNAINSSTNLYIYFYNLGDSSKYSFVTAHSNGIHTTGNHYNSYWGVGVFEQASFVNGIRIFGNLGNMTGSLSLYGLRFS
ncbi:2-phosphosulfolactate phosphatase [uncultured Mediterranean phage uvMED]|nr:2-phosphosulfolactate phosphatase [uncultured Mediterranean phage uvMED]